MRMANLLDVKSALLGREARLLVERSKFSSCTSKCWPASLGIRLTGSTNCSRGNGDLLAPPPAGQPDHGCKPRGGPSPGYRYRRGPMSGLHLIGQPYPPVPILIQRTPQLSDVQAALAGTASLAALPASPLRAFAYCCPLRRFAQSHVRSSEQCLSTERTERLVLVAMSRAERASVKSAASAATFAPSDRLAFGIWCAIA